MDVPEAEDHVLGAGVGELPEPVDDLVKRFTAGMAYPSRGLIHLNPRLREFGDDEVNRTLRHELAHLLAHHRAGRRVA